jgi:hypothetical protein
MRRAIIFCTAFNTGAAGAILHRAPAAQSNNRLEHFGFPND